MNYRREEFERITRQTQQKPTLVLVGTGETGRRVAERLRTRGSPRRIGMPSCEPPFDWEDRTSPASRRTHLENDNQQNAWRRAATR
jgi:hypothetical protein